MYVCQHAASGWLVHCSRGSPVTGSAPGSEVRSDVSEVRSTRVDRRSEVDIRSAAVQPPGPPVSTIKLNRCCTCVAAEIRIRTPTVSQKKNCVVAAWEEQGAIIAHPKFLAVKKCTKVFYLSENFRSTMRNLGPKISILRKFSGKVEILSIHNLPCRTCATGCLN